MSAARHWFTAQEIADLALPGLPGSKRKINELAAAERWAFKTNSAGEPLARPRQGRGAGFEYHWALLPASAKHELVRRGIVVTIEDLRARPSRSKLWAWFEEQTDAVKAEARRRLAALDAVDALQAAGMTRTVAISLVAAEREVSQATLWNWLKLVEGSLHEDRLPRLAPRRKGGGKEAEIHDDAWQALISDYLRPEKPTFASCVERVRLTAAAKGWGELPNERTLFRRVERTIDPRVIVARRDGADALRRMLPPSKRSVADLHALELVNVDGHKFDVFVTDGERIFRPILVGIQDVFSRKFLAWRIGESESAVLTRLAFADLFKTWGIPRAAYLDNGRAFASKWITGGASNRFRFKVRDEEPLGLLTSVGIEIHWTLPYRGQSKPIERTFRDFCDRISKHPEFAGAYTGNRPDAKPENYQSRAVDLAKFLEIVGQGIALHNAREGRRTEMGRGSKSFDQVFAESYASAPIGKATPEQLRMALLAADKVRADRKSGAVRLYENTYWTSELSEFAGRDLVVRFDPDALHTEVHVYDLDGRFVVTAPIWEAVGFADAEAAQRRAKLEASWRKATKAATERLDLLRAHELAALLPAPEPEPTPEPKVVRMSRFHGATRGAAALKVEPEAQARVQADTPELMDRIGTAVRRLRSVE